MIEIPLEPNQFWPEPIYKAIRGERAINIALREGRQMGRWAIDKSLKRWPYPTMMLDQRLIWRATSLGREE